MVPGDASLTPTEKRDNFGRGTLAKRRYKIPYSALKYLLAFVDAVLIISASIIGGGLYQFFANGNLYYVDPMLGVGTIAALLYVLIGHSTGLYTLRSAFAKQNKGAVAELVGIEVGVVSGVINLESSGVEASDWRLRHEQAYHEARFLAACD